ncbi:ZDHHC-type palmitoyltransferase 6 [Oopsacas minuta]|uniref:Palmitoyltransferase n=1 Tax=Oopsacas minuta TaxID=111878 RepID=A0AAV7K7Y9_9METZ|nr:ZDHHC-type palmitoyltransferase 6 [Oopsacas minuta]
MSIVFSFITSGKYDKVSELFHSDPNSTTCKDEQDNLALHHLAYRNQQALVKFLISHGNDVTAVNQNGETAFHLACQSGSAYTVHILLNSITSPNECLSCRDNMGRTPVHHAAYSGNPEMLHYLYLNWGVDLNDRDIRSWNTLHICAALAHHRSILYLLRGEKVPLLSQTAQGDTALHLVLQKQSLLTVWYMVVTSGEIAHIPDQNGQTPLDILRKDERKSVRNFTPLIEAVIIKRTFATRPWHIWLLYFLGPIISYDLALISIYYIPYPYGYLFGFCTFLAGWLYFLSPHRLPHPTGWESPGSMGLLVLGATHVGFSYLILIAPYFYPYLFNTISLVSIFLFSIWLFFTARGGAQVVKFGSENRENQRQKYTEKFPLHDEPSSYAKSLQFCHVCELLQCPRSKHCKLCDTCVLEFDHHCAWLNCCIGSGNHHRFFILMHFMSFTVLQYMASVIAYWIDNCETSNLLSLFLCASYYHRILLVLFICSGVCMVFLANAVFLQWVYVSQMGTFYFRPISGFRLGYLTRFRNIILFLTDYQDWVQRREINQFRIL